MDVIVISHMIDIKMLEEIVLLNGTTHISPDQLETAIKNNDQWSGGHYNVLNHNCHDFVRFCLDRIGCPESMIKKVGPCYKKQK